ncbi:MAG TPA: hypothetical protein VFY93_10715 [Planctomycetota bacterium]|nr:hypothetical protein [Planctomycetota bacterium]
MPKAKSRGGTGRVRRLALLLPALLAAWLLLSHFVVRARIEGWLRRTFRGDAKVSWALLWPNFDATAFGVSVETAHHRIEAARVVVGIKPLAFFGGPSVDRVEVHDLVGEFDEGEPVELLRVPAGGEEGAPGEEAAPAAAAPAPVPPRAPPLVFFGPRVFLRRPDGPPSLAFRAARLDATQAGELMYRLEADGGALSVVPFERLTARLIPRAGHLLLSRMRVQAFHGMVAGMLDVDTARAGGFNGEVEWRFVEVDEVWKTYGLPYAEKRKGDLAGKVVFSADRVSLDALKGKGEIQLENAAFFSPLSFKVFLVMKVPVAAEAPLTRGTMTCSFEDSRFYLEAARFDARDFSLDGQGIVSFAGGCDLEISHAGTVVAVSGRIDDPKITVLPFSAITAPVDRLFRERVK